jgi:hypothetical protein
MEHWHRARFKQFYDISTIKNKLAYDDPKMGFGYISLGKLTGNYDREILVNQVGSCYNVVRWKTF